MLSVIKPILDDLDFEKRRNMAGQLSLFGGDDESKPSTQISVPELNEFPLMELLKMERDMTGFFLSGHPVSEYEWYANRINATRIGDIISLDSTVDIIDGDRVRLVCIVSKYRTQITKSNQMMAFVTAEDRSGIMELVVFPKTLAEFGSLLYEGSVICVDGTVNLKEDEDAKVLINRVSKIPSKDEVGDKPVIPQPKVNSNRPQLSSDKSTPKTQKKINALYLKLTDMECKEFKKAKNLLEIFDGPTPVVLYLTSSKKQLMAPRSLWVDVNDVLLRELKKLLGEESVKLKFTE